MNKLTKYQEVANGVYPDYAIQTVVEDPYYDGDTLAEFIVLVLDEDCEDIDMAIQRMGTAIDELQAVQMALLKAKGEGVV